MGFMDGKPILIVVESSMNDLVVPAARIRFLLFRLELLLGLLHTFGDSLSGAKGFTAVPQRCVSRCSSKAVRAVRCSALYGQVIRTPHNDVIVDHSCHALVCSVAY